MIIFRERKPISEPVDLDESQSLDEMSIRVISSMRRDGLSFRVTVKSPDHSPPHAHLMDLATGKKEFGQFLIPKSFPKSPSDIKDYKKGITDETRQEVFEWLGKPNWDALEIGVKINNWHALMLDWKKNEK